MKLTSNLLVSVYFSFQPAGRAEGRMLCTQARGESAGISQSSSLQTQSTSASQISRRIKASGELLEEEKARNDEIDAWCLMICIGILKHVNGVHLYIFFNSGTCGSLTFEV